MAQYKTLLLDQSKWDLVLDSAGNIAVASPPYSIAQDIASAVRLFLGELIYDTEKGIPYFEEILGQAPPQSLLTGYIEAAALTVPGVASAICLITSSENRTVNGIIQFTDDSGASNAINF